MTWADDEGGEAGELEIPDETWSPAERLERSETRESVRRGLDSLSPQYREILLLREINGLSYDEISEALGIEPGTVKSRIFRARKKLCDFLLSEGNIPGPGASKRTEGRNGCMSRCENFLEMSSRYLDGDLNPDEEQSLLSHLAECPDCRRAYEAMRAVSLELDVTDAPEGFAAGVMGAVRAAAPGRRPRRLARAAAAPRASPRWQPAAR